MRLFKEGKDNRDIFAADAMITLWKAMFGRGRCQFPDFTNPEVRCLVGQFV